MNAFSVICEWIKITSSWFPSQMTLAASQMALIKDDYNLVKTSDNLNKLNSTRKHMRPKHMVLFLFPKHQIEKNDKYKNTQHKTLLHVAHRCVSYNPHLLIVHRKHSLHSGLFRMVSKNRWERNSKQSPNTNRIQLFSFWWLDQQWWISEVTCRVVSLYSGCGSGLPWT